MIKGLELLSCGESLRVVGLFRLEKKRLGGSASVYGHLKWGNNEDGAKLFQAVSSDRKRGNGHKQKCIRFCLNMRKHFLTVMVTYHGYRLSKGCESSGT